LEKRVEEHEALDACRTTALDPPVSIIYSETFETFLEAPQREAQVKRWSRSKKEALVSGDVAKLRKLAKSRNGKISMP
jgi:putative endonuclease